MWQKTKISNLCEITSSKRIYAADYRAEGVPFFRGKEIIEKHKGNLEVSTELFISEEKFLEIKSKFGVPQQGDLLLTSVGTLGVPYVVKSGEKFYFKDGNLTWFRLFKNLDSQYLFYWLISPQGKAQLKRCTIGSSQPAFTIVLLKDMEIQLPPLHIQRRISAVLSAYDELIENNLRRIKILEEMAQSIYREWFVKFRFPGHQKVKMVDSPLGKIPEKWEVKNLFEVADVTYGFPFKSSRFNVNREGIAVVRIRDVLNGQSTTFTTEDAPDKYIVHDGDFLVGMDGDFHMGFWAGGTAFLVQRVARFRPRRDVGRYFLALALKEPIKHFNKTITGTTVSHLGDSHLRTINIIMPDKKLLKIINDILEPLLDLQLNIRAKNKNLRQTRDLLLPKLISGELDVSEMDIRMAGKGDE